MGWEFSLVFLCICPFIRFLPSPIPWRSAIDIPHPSVPFHLLSPVQGKGVPHSAWWINGSYITAARTLPRRSRHADHNPGYSRMSSPLPIGLASLWFSTQFRGHRHFAAAFWRIRWICYLIRYLESLLPVYEKGKPLFHMMLYSLSS